MLASGTQEKQFCKQLPGLRFCEVQAFSFEKYFKKHEILTPEPNSMVFLW